MTTKATFCQLPTTPIFAPVFNGTCVLGFGAVQVEFSVPFGYTCIVYSVVALNVSPTLLCDDAKFK